MNNKFKNIKKLLHLSTKEKANLWEKIESNIFSYEKNVRILDNSSLNNGEIIKDSQILHFNKKSMLATIITSLLIMLSGGVSFAAETSVPGDLLYPIKVNVNEAVQSAFTLGAENEANLQLHLIEERVKEKAALEAEGKLTADVDSEIKARIEKHSENFEKEKESIQNKGDDEVASKLELRFSSLIDNFGIQTAIQAGGDVNLGSGSTRQERERNEERNENEYKNEVSSGKTDNENDDSDSISIGVDGAVNVGLGNRNETRNDDIRNSEDNYKGDDNSVRTNTSLKTELENNNSEIKADVNTDLGTSLNDDKGDGEDESITSGLKIKGGVDIK
nr:DUF5667 domain-containing protein [Candidatus Gracilibacteria bacterium]